MCRLLSFALPVLIWAAAASAAEESAELKTDDSQWGSVSGRVVFSGDLEDPFLERFRRDIPLYSENGHRVLARPMIHRFDGQPAPRVVATEVNRTLLIDDKTRGIRNVFVYLKQPPEKIHPQLLKQKDEPAKIVSRYTRFVPRVRAMQVGQTLQMTALTPDAAANFHIFPIRNFSFNYMISPLKTREWTPRKAESFPIRINNDLNGVARAWLLILDHPYYALTKRDGSFTLENLPVGEHELWIWHETVGYVAKKLKVRVSPDTVEEIEPTELTLEMLGKKKKKKKVPPNIARDLQQKVQDKE